MAYAAETSVPVERSKAEIERILTRYGATKYGQATDMSRSMILFSCRDRQIRMLILMPKACGDTAGERKKYEQEHRRIWRALCLVVKAKLEAVESGIETFEEAFLPHIIMPDGKTMAEHALPQIAIAYKTGRMPPLLLGMGSGQ